MSDVDNFYKKIIKQLGGEARDYDEPSYLPTGPETPDYYTEELENSPEDNIFKPFDTDEDDQYITNINKIIFEPNEILEPNSAPGQVKSYTEEAQDGDYETIHSNGNVYHQAKGEMNPGTSYSHKEGAKDCPICGNESYAQEKDYPWDTCIKEQTAKYGADSAKKICGSIKAKYGGEGYDDTCPRCGSTDVTRTGTKGTADYRRECNNCGLGKSNEANDNMNEDLHDDTMNDDGTNANVGEYPKTEPDAMSTMDKDTASISDLSYGMASEESYNEFLDRRKKENRPLKKNTEANDPDMSTGLHEDASPDDNTNEFGEQQANTQEEDTSVVSDTPLSEESFRKMLKGEEGIKTLPSGAQMMTHNSPEEYWDQLGDDRHAVLRKHGITGDQREDLSKKSWNELPEHVKDAIHNNYTPSTVYYDQSGNKIGENKKKDYITEAASAEIIWDNLTEGARLNFLRSLGMSRDIASSIAEMHFSDLSTGVQEKIEQYFKSNEADQSIGSDNPQDLLDVDKSIGNLLDETGTESKRMPWDIWNGASYNSRRKILNHSGMDGIRTEGYESYANEVSIDDFRRIRDNRSAEELQFQDGKDLVDMQTANAIVSVYDRLSPENQEKAKKLIQTTNGVIKMAGIAFGEAFTMTGGKYPSDEDTTKDETPLDDDAGNSYAVTDQIKDKIGQVGEGVDYETGLPEGPFGEIKGDDEYDPSTGKWSKKKNKDSEVTEWGNDSIQQHTDHATPLEKDGKVNVDGQMSDYQKDVQDVDAEPNMPQGEAYGDPKTQEEQDEWHNKLKEQNKERMSKLSPENQAKVWNAMGGKKDIDSLNFNDSRKLWMEHGKYPYAGYESYASEEIGGICPYCGGEVGNMYNHVKNDHPYSFAEWKKAHVSSNESDEDDEEQQKKFLNDYYEHSFSGKMLRDKVDALDKGEKVPVKKHNYKTGQNESEQDPWFTCPICPLVFFSEGERDQHVANAHEPESADSNKVFENLVSDCGCDKGKEAFYGPLMEKLGGNFKEMTGETSTSLGANAFMAKNSWNAFGETKGVPKGIEPKEPSEFPDMLENTPEENEDYAKKNMGAKEAILYVGHPGEDDKTTVAKIIDNVDDLQDESLLKDDDNTKKEIKSEDKKDTKESFIEEWNAMESIQRYEWLVGKIGAFEVLDKFMGVSSLKWNQMDVATQFNLIKLNQFSAYSYEVKDKKKAKITSNEAKMGSREDVWDRQLDYEDRKEKLIDANASWTWAMHDWKEIPVTIRDKLDIPSIGSEYYRDPANEPDPHPKSTCDKCHVQYQDHGDKGDIVPANIKDEYDLSFNIWDHDWQGEGYYDDSDDAYDRYRDSQL